MNNHIYSTLFKTQERESDRRSQEIEQRKESQKTYTNKTTIPSTSIQMRLGLGLRLGDIRESGETGDSREEKDTQWRLVITLYTRILKTFADSAYFVSLT